jgi:hypothetical protein
MPAERAPMRKVREVLRLRQPLAKAPRGTCRPHPFDPTVWTGRVLQARCDEWRRLVLRFCIRPLNGAVLLLAIMDIRAHPISFSERP